MYLCVYLSVYLLICWYVRHRCINLCRGYVVFYQISSIMNMNLDYNLWGLVSVMLDTSFGNAWRNRLETRVQPQGTTKTSNQQHLACFQQHVLAMIAPNALGGFGFPVASNQSGFSVPLNGRSWWSKTGSNRDENHFKKPTSVFQGGCFFTIAICRMPQGVDTRNNAWWYDSTSNYSSSLCSPDLAWKIVIPCSFTRH